MESRLRSICLQLALSGCLIAWMPSASLALQVDSPSEASSDQAQRTTLVLKFKTDRGVRESVGEVLAEYRDGSLLFLTPDGQLWTILGSDIEERRPADGPMQPMTSEEIYEKLKSELAPGFMIHRTKHYVIVFNTSGAYAKWVGELFERLYRGFNNYWKKNHALDLEEPRFPLVAVVFRDKPSYLQFAEREVGNAAKAMIGYYNQKTNRMITYDLTGASGVGGGRPHGSNTQMINTLLAQPKAERTVATVVHEAVHQIAYNSGLQVRLAANPRWLSEGLAMYFESPDLTSRTGWTMGKVNYHNLQRFAQFLPRRTPDSLTTLIGGDDRMVDSKLAAQAYPESWALTYYLMKRHREPTKDYLLELQELEPLGEVDARQRVSLFKKHFGDDLDELDRDFIRFMRTIR